MKTASFIPSIHIMCVCVSQNHEIGSTLYCFGNTVFMILSMLYVWQRIYNIMYFNGDSLVVLRPDRKVKRLEIKVPNIVAVVA